MISSLARLKARNRRLRMLLVLPAALFILLLFVYPFLYGMLLSVQPKAGAETVGQQASDPTDLRTLGRRERGG